MFTINISSALYLFILDSDRILQHVPSFVVFADKRKKTTNREISRKPGRTKRRVRGGGGEERKEYRITGNREKHSVNNKIPKLLILLLLFCI